MVINAPQQQDDLIAKLSDRQWRLSNLYYIVTKDEGDGGEGRVVLFRPNRAQRRLFGKLHNRNIILKARQLGMTTGIAILWLDWALWSKDPVRLGIIAHEREAAENIFRDKVCFAYDRLPDAVRAMCPVDTRNKTEISFKHNEASIRVATSMRSGTIHGLLISEMGKIARKYPHKAREIVTGSIPAVPNGGITVIESTAEGQDGHFYEYAQQAMRLRDSHKTLTTKDYRLHFYAWWEAPEYVLDHHSMAFTEAELEYFRQTEARIGRRFSEGQRAWYVATLRNDFVNEAPLMWQEYPSYPEEAFKISLDGCYYSAQLATARRMGRIRADLPVERAPVYTFWDLGRSDMTAIWCMQHIGPEYRWIWYYENSGEELSHYVEQLQGKPWIYGSHWLPHEADYKRLGERPDTNKSLRQQMAALWPGQRIEVVPVVSNIGAGIQSTRAGLAVSWFDEAACSVGLGRLTNYRKAWDQQLGRWKDIPLHDDNSHGADAFRQWAQKWAAGESFSGSYSGASPDSIGSAMLARAGWRGRKRLGAGGRPGMSA